MISRRQFVSLAAIAPFAGTVLCKAGVAAEGDHQREDKNMSIQSGQKVLFQGDSITDCGRSRENLADLGVGYPFLIEQWLTAAYPDRKIEFVNRGISGNCVDHLKARWKEDCLDLKPDWISVLIGVNDSARRTASNDKTTPDTYEQDYRDILLQAKKASGARFILCEPFILNTNEDVQRYREEIDMKVEVVHRLAKEFDAALIPFDKIFQKVCQYREPAFWAADGVHPSNYGHMLMAQHWIQAVGG